MLEDDLLKTISTVAGVELYFRQSIADHLHRFAHRRGSVGEKTFASRKELPRHTPRNAKANHRPGQ